MERILKFTGIVFLLSLSLLMFSSLIYLGIIKNEMEAKTIIAGIIGTSFCLTMASMLWINL